jgi:prevent-host-death family protein
MREIGAFEAKSKLGTLLDWVEGGEEVLITRRGKAVARLVPAAIGFDRARAAEAAQRIRDRAEKLQGSFSWAEWKALRDEGRA